MSYLEIMILTFTLYIVAHPINGGSGNRRMGGMWFHLRSRNNVLKGGANSDFRLLADSSRAHSPARPTQLGPLNTQDAALSAEPVSYANVVKHI